MVDEGPPTVDYPYVLVQLRCDVCKRTGAYRLARLAVKYGAIFWCDCQLIARGAMNRAGPAERASSICRPDEPQDLPAVLKGFEW